VLNGADGLSEVAAGLVSQGMAILDSVKKGMAGGSNEPRPAALTRGDEAGPQPDGE